MLEQLRAELHDYIMFYGITDKRTLKKSRQINKEINKVYKNKK